MGEPKNNLGPTDLPTLAFRIAETKVADTDEGPVLTGRIVWDADRDTSIRDVLESAGGTPEDRTAGSEAGLWLTRHLTDCGGSDDSATIKAAGFGAGHSAGALRRGRLKIGAVIEGSGFPRRTYWTLPGTSVQSVRSSGTRSGRVM